MLVVRVNMVSGAGWSSTVGAVASQATAVGLSSQSQVRQISLCPNNWNFTNRSFFLAQSITIHSFSDQIASPFVIDPKKLKEKEVDTIIVEVKLNTIYSRRSLPLWRPIKSNYRGKTPKLKLWDKNTKSKTGSKMKIEPLLTKIRIWDHILIRMSNYGIGWFFCFDRFGFIQKWYDDTIIKRQKTCFISLNPLRRRLL